MLTLDNHTFRFSASDLTAFSGCTHATWMDYMALTNENEFPIVDEGSFEELLIKKGNEHERNVLEKYKSEFTVVTEIPNNRSFEDQVDLTSQAITAGADVIYQAVLTDHTWVGHADFLIKCDIPSKLGPFSYEVVDTKLGNSPKPEHIVQLCTYSDLLGIGQGILPKKMHLIMGNHNQESFSVLDFYSYYLNLKARFELFVKEQPSTSSPEPCEHCNVCHWQKICKTEWQEKDHLRLISNITRAQRDKINKKISLQ